MKKETNVRISEKAIKEVLKAEISKSKKMLQLFEGGLEVKEISELMGVRYNFAYNVISNYINMNDIEVVYEKKQNKKDIIVQLLAEGKSVKDISKELKLNMNYIYKVAKEIKEEQKAKEA